MTAEEALAHPYLAKFHNPAEEHSLTYDVVPPVDDDVQLSVAEYRTKLYDVRMISVYSLCNFMTDNLTVPKKLISLKYLVNLDHDQ